MRVVLDSGLRLPPDARIAQAPGLIVYSCRDGAEAVAALKSRGIGHMRVGAACGTGRGVNLPEVVSDLAHREVHAVHVESGAALSGAFIEQALVDELLLYLAPSLLVAGRGIADLPVPHAVQGAFRFQLCSVQEIGGDVRLVLRKQMKSAD
jgi:diaminohydroxyphosphoribosylaminopyrimidine deaminase/5-amino-6-(5-phosphoribosylamino)uracil reductase